jgi:hypothetical protein
VIFKHHIGVADKNNTKTKENEKFTISAVVCVLNRIKEIKEEAKTSK